MHRFTIALLLSIIFCAWSGATYITPDDTVPAERLVENLTRFIENYPEDAGAVYTLGRVYGFAYANGRGEFAVYKRAYWEPAFHELPSRRSGGAGEASEKRLNDLLQAIRHMRRAVELKPENGLYWLGLGYICREAAGRAGEAGWPPSEIDFDKTASAKANDSRYWEDQALEAYRKARGFDPDPYPVEGVAADAACAIWGILEKRPELTGQEKKELRRAKRVCSHASSRPPMITPVIFSVDNLPLEKLASPAHVAFDLDGMGRGLRWSWVRPGTAILAWDPHRTGRIESGRQLFGNVTWWMFWRNGYEPLGALDNNGDGWLEGAELEGIAVWRDMNGNGVSDAGEATPAAAFGVRAINTRAAGKTGNTLWTSEGVKMSDGTVLATYDWVSAPERSGK